MASLPFDDRWTKEYGLLRDELDRAGTIGPNDLLMAATARARGCVLGTHHGEFSRVPGLRFEDWE